jgi:hypothetical protein
MKFNGTQRHLVYADGNISLRENLKKKKKNTEDLLVSIKEDFPEVKG